MTNVYFILRVFLDSRMISAFIPLRLPYCPGGALRCRLLAKSTIGIDLNKAGRNITMMAPVYAGRYITSKSTEDDPRRPMKPKIQAKKEA